MDTHTILLLDSDRDFSEAAESYLKNSEFETVCVRNSDDVKSRIRLDNREYLVLTDTKSEPEIGAFLKKNKIPFILISDKTERDLKIAKEVLPHGFYDKNSDLSLLVYIINFALRLNEQENRYRSLFYDNRSIMLIINPDTGEIKEANNAACRFYGYNRETLTNLNINKINTLSQQEIYREMQLCKQEKRTFFQFVHRLSSGDTRDVEVFTGPIAIGNEFLLYSIIHDVSKKKKLEKELIQRNRQLELIFNASSDFMGLIRWTGEDNFILESFNTAYWDAITNYNKAISREQIKGKSLLEISEMFHLPDSVMKNSIGIYKKIMKDGEAFETVEEIQNENFIFYLKAQYIPLSSDSRGDYLFLYSGKNISEEIEKEKNLKKESEFSQILYKLYKLSEELNEEKVFRFIRENTASLTESSACDIVKVSEENRENLSGETEQILELVLQEKKTVITDNRRNFDTLSRQKEQQKDRMMFSPVFLHEKICYLISLSGKQIPYSDRDLFYMDMISNEISKNLDKMKFHENLKRSELQLREVVNSMERAIAIYKPKDNGSDFTFIDMNEFAEKLTHYRKREVLGKSISELFPGAAGLGLIETLRKTWETGISSKIPLKEYRDDRISLWVENYIYKLPSGNVAAMFEDTLLKHKAEEKIKYLLNEKEMLLKEVHHRIKNNMTIVQNLLKMHSVNMIHDEAVKALDDAAGRIMSMQILYDKLYNSEDYRYIPVREYMNQLIYEIRDYYIGSKNIEVSASIDNMDVDSKIIFNLGIILNELLTNSMKYAFGKEERGKIDISFKKNQDNFYFCYKDNGSGFNNTRQHSGFGVKLIEILVYQLNAEMTVRSDQGVCYILEFKNSRQ